MPGPYWATENDDPPASKRRSDRASRSCRNSSSEGRSAASVTGSREHLRAKTDRLDTELLKRGFLGWLRGERGHCTMARIPTIAEEDAKRPNRERECLVRERTRIVYRMKGTLARLGIRNFLRQGDGASCNTATLHTPEGSP